MGLFKKHSGTLSATQVASLGGNPNPKNFEILKVKQVGLHLVAKVKYPDATNFEGIKILLFLDLPEGDLRRCNSLDPHFRGELRLPGARRWNPAPFARFVPTKDGWQAAVTLARKLK